jgi:lysophospholipase L1-like esterase
VPLVDVYAAWVHDPNRYNSADGRHPNAAGYRLIAETFFAAIRAEFENR